MPKTKHPLRLVDAADPNAWNPIEHPEFFDVEELAKWARENPDKLNVGIYPIVRDLGVLVVSTETLRKVKAKYE